MMKKVWLILLAVVLVFGFAVLGCGGGGGGGDDGGDDEFVPFEFSGPFTEDLYNLGGSGGKTFVYDDETGFISFENDGTTAGSATFKFNFADIDYTLNRSDVLIFTYEIEVTTPEAVIVAKDPSDWGADFAGDSEWGIGKGREYVLGNATKSVYEGSKVNGTWNPDTKTGTFEVLMKYLSRNATGIGFQHNSYAEFSDVGRVGLNSAYSLKITKIENKGGEAPVDPDEPGDVDWPDITDALKFAEYESAGSGKWAIDQKLPFTFFIIATVGGGTADGFGGVQIGVQGGGVTQEVRTTGNFTALSHTETEIIYFVIDISGYDNYSQVVTQTGWKQFYINYGKAVLGTYQGYVVDGTKTLVTKPADAVDFELEGTEDKEVVPGFATKTIPTFSVDNSYHAVTSITYTGGTSTLVDTELTLSATVAPTNATNKTIIWSCADTTNVTINGNKFTASAAGEYTVVATITNGLTETTPFVKNDISITVVAPSGVAVEDYTPDNDAWATLQLIPCETWVNTTNSPTATPVTDAGDTIGYNLAYTLSTGADYDNAYYVFKVTFADGVTLADYDKVTFDLEGKAGDVGYKDIALYAANSLPTGKPGTATAPIVTNKFQSGAFNEGGAGNGIGKKSVTLTIDKSKALELSGNEYYVSIFMGVARANKVGNDFVDPPTEYEITNVVFTTND